MREQVKRFPLVSFFVLAYAVSWAYWVPLLALGYRVAPGSATTHFPGLLGPAVAACVVEGAIHGKAGLRALLGKLVLVSRPRWRFCLYSLSPMAFLGGAFLVMALRGVPVPGPAEFARFSGLPEIGLPAVVLLVFLVGGCGEELGWRGFALQRLQRRFGPLGGALVLALFWAGWHLPAFGFIQTYRDMTVPMILGGFLFGLACGSVVLARVAHQTAGSVLAASLWHAAYNLTSATAAGGGLVAGFTTMCVVVWALVLTVLELRRTRTGSLLLVKPSADQSPGPDGSQVKNRDARVR